MESNRCFVNEFDDVEAFDSLLCKKDDEISIKSDIQTELNRGLEKILQDINQASKSFDKHDISVYTGISGIGLLYLGLYKAFNNVEYIDSAFMFAKSAVKRLRGKRVTFLCGDAGPLALLAVVYHIKGETRKSKECVDSLIKLSNKALSDPEMCDELLYGRAGYLFALLFVNKHISNTSVPREVIDQVVKSIMDSGKEGKHGSSPSLMYTWHSKAYIGAAHGLAGIYYILLSLLDSYPEYKEMLKSCIDYIVSLQFPSGNFPSSLGNKDDRLLHWCHGAPGCIHLMIKAYKVFGEETYLNCAQKASEVIWQRGLLKKGYGLCHGTSGNGYAFLAMYQLTRESKYLIRAIQFGLWCCGYQERLGLRTPDRPYSLFEGIAGAAHFIAGLLNFSDAKFPAFEI